MFVVGVIIVCISMFQMSLVPVVSFRFLAMLLYQICVLVEMYLWCYYGNEVILKVKQSIIIDFYLNLTFRVIN